jgi:zinc/manganese transport system substrate-binding protein
MARMTFKARRTAMRIVASVLLLALVCGGASGRTLDVVTTSSSGGLLIRQVAGGHASVTVLGPPDRDLHYLQARPSMMRALRSADLLIAVGADLEIGWLPVALRQSANPHIQPGKPGYFEFAAHVELLDVGGVADRSLGDVHPFGNPHVHMDPVRMAALATLLAERFAALDPDHGDHFRDHAAQFVEAIENKLPEWESRLTDAPGAVLFHQDANYLFYRFDVPLHGFLEPVPGVPPTAAHIRDLTNSLKGERGIVLHTTFQPERAPQALAEALGWSRVRLMLEPPLGSTGADYITHIETWIEALARVE